MNILIVGGAGREHALAWKIAQSPAATKLYCAPGNPGIAALAQCVPLAADDIIGLRAFAQEHHVDLTVVGPEGPLAAGIVDEFRRHKLRIFGPQRAAARVESSKVFSKDLMTRLRIPTAEAKSFTATSGAFEYLERRETPIVVKADGLAQGKGVVVARTRGEARDAVTAMLDGKAFGEAGARVVIEQFLEGEEMTVMAFTDGKTIVPMIPAQDHKRLGDGDTGPNTGGMGAYAPAPIGSPKLLDQVRRTILEPAVEGLAQLGSPFQGVLYAGVMVSNGVPRVLEFNARLGDPETQAVLPLLKTDLVDLLIAATEHRLDQASIEWKPGVAVCVVLAAGGYPRTIVKGTPIYGLDKSGNTDRLLIFHAGTATASSTSDEPVTAGGRVLGITGIGDDFASARARAYAAVDTIRFEGMQYRTDIGSRAFA
ncbi:MAG TPA: phosphoribosylamine--glycine ligase [Nitrospirales bacterium]